MQPTDDDDGDDDDDDDDDDWKLPIHIPQSY